MAYIYQIINDINGKKYIGQTNFSIDKRFKEHCRDARKERNKNRPLYIAMNKYGTEHFHISIIEETDNSEERETYWIEYYGTFKNGYNYTLGGNGKRYLDYDLIVATYNKVKNCNEVARLLNISADSVSNVLHSLDVEIEQGGHVVREIMSKPVAKIDKYTNEIIEVFPSIKCAERSLGIKYTSHIDKVCQGKRKTCNGYKWEYLS